MIIKFNNSDNKFKIAGMFNFDKVIVLVGLHPMPVEPIDGFKIYKGEILLEDYSDYKYKFNILTEFNDAIILSKDKDFIETEDNPASNYYISPKQFTDEQYQDVLSQNKEEKVALLKAALATFLEGHPIVSSAHNGVSGIYSVTSEKQALMSNQYMTYQIEKKINPNAKLTWNESGKECEVWTEQEFLQLIVEIKTYVYPLVSYQQSLETRIMNCTTQEELDDIVVDYSSAVTK